MDVQKLTPFDYLWLTLFCTLLFGICLVSGRPLSIHEAVLPQTSRIMLADGDLVIPKTGQAPWLESPPLPQWITVALAFPFGACDSLLVARLGNVLMATFIVLMTASIGGRLLGRTAGLLSGLILATMCEFTKYAWLAEDEIYLCFIITCVVFCFVSMEFSETSTRLKSSLRPLTLAHTVVGFFTGRPWKMVLFFVLLGMTNLCKGLLFGMVLALIPCVSFIVLQRRWVRLQPYLWTWGVLLTIGIAIAWPYASYLRYPDVLDVWMFDLGGRMDGKYAAINQPLWYYPLNLLWMLAPWTFVIPAAFYLTARNAWQDSRSPERFLWCWALLVPLVLSIPQGKHHHYMLHALAPWAILGSLGSIAAYRFILNWPAWLKHPAWSLLSIATPACLAIVLFWDKLPGPESISYGLLVAIPVIAFVLAYAIVRCQPTIAVGTVFTVVAGRYIFGHLYAGSYLDKNRLDAWFCQSITQHYTSANQPTPVLLDLGFQTHRAFLCQFYLPDNVTPLHNLSFLKSDHINSSEAYVLSLSGKQEELEQYGEVEIKTQISTGAGGKPTTHDRLTLYHIRFPETIERIATDDLRISPMQGMNRAEGPILR